MLCVDKFMAFTHEDVYKRQVSFCPLYALPFVLCEAVPLCCTLEFDAPPLDASAFSRTDRSISSCIPPSAVLSPASAEAESAAAVLPLPTVLNAGISPPPVSYTHLDVYKRQAHR